MQMSGATVAVEMGETWVSRADGERLVAHGLGACVGLCLYDAVAHLAAMVHVVLPETLTPPAGSSLSRQTLLAAPGKCADTAVRHAVQEVVAQGAQRGRLQAAIAGGAQIFTHASQSGGHSASLSRLEIGSRNVVAVRAALEAESIPLIAEDVGGSYGRTLTLRVGSGDLFVRRIGAEEHLLASLGQLPALPARGREEALLARR